MIARIMTPAARLQATIDLLTMIDHAPVPMDTVTGDYFRPRRYIGSKDRAAIVERTYTLIRHHGRLTWWAARLDITPDPRAQVLLGLSLIDQLPPTEIANLFDGTPYGPTPLAPAETAMIADLAGKKLEPEGMSIETRLECPSEHVDKLHRLSASLNPDNPAVALSDMMGALLIPATLDLRINPMKVTREAAIKSLAADAVTAVPTPFAPLGLRLTEKTFLSATNAFRHGLVDIQDEGSQLIAHVCGAAPGMQVLDYCAGGGGKTLALAAAMRNKGRIVAMDQDSRRLDKARQRLRRAGVADIVEVRPLDDDRHRKWLRRQKGTFDVVLVDVPCSGSGTWRRNPDTRWRNFGPTLEELQKTQAEILDRVAATVKPGGRLVYATCSLFIEENDDQIAAFLSRHPEFQIARVPDIWPAGTPCPVTGDFLRLFPHLHQTDGFFAAILTNHVIPDNSVIPAEAGIP